ncbi:uncharacterized protein TA15620 [Theileria annulata]|uniref:Uncharacterized protein n=1 Tax=Theileria annulata TaxID=5874 RepID=Q4UFL1_THEAN|nr:uncharacterized protein TA15620 [Theileria annulata]CAI74105.1 hypothetical protein TA15620 [Theileria annulata]|eukprot:XP_951837.1 hypothetical protein TA15620 [Theileria annulata]
MVVKWLVRYRVLVIQAGSSSGEGLRGKADALYQAANNLYSAVHTAGNAAAAKVLKYKAGAEPTKGLRKLAKELHSAAQALATAAKGDDGKAAENLATAVGANETDGNLRQKLRELAEASSDLSNKAQAVKTAYEGSGDTGVKQKFQLVQTKKTEYDKNDTAKAKYQAVEKAWTAFNAVYNPEAQLKDAVGADDTGPDGEPTTLRQALYQLGSAKPLSSGLSTKAQNVKNKYGSDWGGVKQKYNNVVKQADEYEKGGDTIKGKYDTLKDAWKTFNNPYREAIYIIVNLQVNLLPLETLISKTIPHLVVNSRKKPTN